MYLQVIDRYANIVNINFNNISRFTYTDDNSITTITLNDGEHVEVIGRTAYYILESMVKLVGDLLVLEDVSDELDNLSKLVEFHDKHNGPHGFVRHLREADKTIERVLQHDAHLKDVEQQLEFEFEPTIDKVQLN